MLSADELNNILSIIDRHFLLFVSKTVGPDVLSKEEKESLKNHSIDYEKLYDGRKDIALLNFQLGALSNILSESQMEKFDHKSLVKYIQSGNYIPLSGRTSRRPPARG
jgi:hypothetical protein